MAEDRQERQQKVLDLLIQRDQQTLVDASAANGPIPPYKPKPKPEVSTAAQYAKEEQLKAPEGISVTDRKTGLAAILQGKWFNLHKKHK